MTQTEKMIQEMNGLLTAIGEDKLAIPVEEGGPGKNIRNGSAEGSQVQVAPIRSETRHVSHGTQKSRSRIDNMSMLASLGGGM